MLMTRMRTWSDADLVTAVSHSRNWSEVSKRLGLRAPQPRALRARSEIIGIDFSHFSGRKTWSDDDLRAALEESYTAGGALRCLGIAPTSKSYEMVRARMAHLGLEFQVRPAKRPGQYVVSYRQRLKERLVAERGGRCADCGLKQAPFVFDFDHRDPKRKEFGIASKATRAYTNLLDELEKCDLVCSNCHRWRTHRQRCAGCVYCAGESE